MAAYSPEILLLAALPQGLVAANRQHQITLISPAIARLFALDVDQWLGQPLDTFCAAHHMPTPAELTEERRAFSHGWQQMRVQRLTLPPEAARTDLAIALLISPEDPEQRAMTNFIGTMSHELRTPLTVIRGFTTLLLRDETIPLHPDHRELIEYVGQHASTMTSLISNMILIAGLEMGHLNPDCEALDLNKVIEVALAPLQGQIATKGLNLTIELPAELPQVLADFDQLRMTLSQLLDNAWRYTESGGITVRASVQTGAIQVEVEDSGRGIPQELQPHIFKRFARGESTYIQDYTYYPRGVGLGLSICKQLIELQGGTIWVTSTPGQGSCFCFTLPIAHDDQAL